MTISGILNKIDGRKLTIGEETVVLRKGVDESQYMPLLLSEVEVIYEDDKGWHMVKEIKPALPKTAVEDTKGPMDMAPSVNVPTLKPIFSAQASSFSTVSTPDFKLVQKSDGRTQKDRTITASWAMGAVLNSRALANCNDAMALNTQQTLDRAKKLATELIKWVEQQSS